MDVASEGANGADRRVLVVIMHVPSKPTAQVQSGGTLRLLSLNIQVGLHTSRYRHYVTQAWRHVLPTRIARDNLERIATLAGRYDIVALQEADAGSLRTAQLNQVAHLAELAGFHYWHAAVTRDLRPFAQHCLGCLSRWPLESVKYHALPGWLPGRGALEVEVRPEGCESLRLIIVHLALGRRVRARQLNFLSTLISDRTDTIVLGDLNCDTGELAAHLGVRDAGLRGVHNQHTFPSWRPSRSLDHILVSPTVEVIGATVLEERLSDHLPVATEIRLRLEGGV
jgi:endonuclease/exonuclease/phosphatase family metal-dependent hydrolase